MSATALSAPRRWAGESLTWRPLPLGYEAQGEHFTFQIVGGKGRWRVSYRRGDLNPFMAIGQFRTMREARARAEWYGASL